MYVCVCIVSRQMPEVCIKINFFATSCRLYVPVDNKIAVGKYLQTNMVITNKNISRGEENIRTQSSVYYKILPPTAM